nr:outer membrane protein assembly factor BamB [Lysobacter sp. CAU 1642]
MIALAALALGGCGIFKSKTNRENIEPPTELADIDTGVDVDQIWSESTGKGERQLGLRQAVALDGGRVFAADVEGDLTALDAATGRELWQVETGLRLSGGPGVGEDTLVVGGLDGTVLAYNPDSGSERWRAQVSSEVITRPAVGRGLAVVRVNDGRTYAFSITDGTRRWVYDRGLPSLTLRGNAAPVIAGDLVILGYDNGTVSAVSLEDGSQRWEQTISEPKGRNELDRMVDVDGEIVVSGSEVYVASFNGQVQALDLGSGRPLWNREMSVYAGLALSGDKILVADKNANVWALDRRTGASLWRQDGLAYRWLTAPGVTDRHVVFGDLKGYVHWLSLEDGSLQARERVGRKAVRATPQTGADGVVYVRGIRGKLVAFRAGS